MSPSPLVPLFIGGVEMLMIGAVILVLIFGSRATDVAREAGSAVGKVHEKRQAAEKEIKDVRGEVEEGIEPVKEDLEEVEEDLEAVEEDLEAVEEDLVDESADPGPDVSDQPEQVDPGEDDT